jgi:hypothetical protein
MWVLLLGGGGIMWFRSKYGLEKRHSKHANNRKNIKTTGILPDGNFESLSFI